MDKSYLSYYILNPYWKWAAEFMPAWLAPNVITLLGFLAICINILSILIYIPDLSSPAPFWVYISFAIGLWIYQTMDNIDGKQARKTGTSSPLGELFDHGIDSLNCVLGGLVQAACMGLGLSFAGVFTTFSTCIAMYFSTWETYHTGVLYLGVVNGPTEGIIIAIFVMLLTGLTGPQIWQQQLSEIIPYLGIHKLIGDIYLKDFWVLIMGASVFFVHIPFCVYNVIQTYRRPKVTEEVWYQLVPLLAFCVSIWVWTTSEYSSILTENHLVLFSIAVTFVFGRMTTAIILSHLTKQHFPLWSLPMMPLFFGALLFDLLPRLGIVNKQFSSQFEVMYLWAFLAFTAIYFYQYSSKVIVTLCDFLDINCFTIKKLEPAKMV